MARSNSDFSSKPWDITVTRGDSPIIPVSVADADGAAVDLTGSTVVMDVSDGPDATDTVLFTVTGVLSGTTGKVTFQPTSLQLDVTPGKYYYSVSVLFASTEDRTILNGVLNVEKRPPKA